MRQGMWLQFKLGSSWLKARVQNDYATLPLNFVLNIEYLMQSSERLFPIHWQFSISWLSLELISLELGRTLYELHPNSSSRSLHCKIGWNKTAHCITCRALSPSLHFTAACLPAKVRTTQLLAKLNVRLSSQYRRSLKKLQSPKRPIIFLQFACFTDFHVLQGCCLLWCL